MTLVLNIFVSHLDTDRLLDPLLLGSDDPYTFDFPVDPLSTRIRLYNLFSPYPPDIRESFLTPSEWQDTKDF